MQEYEPQHVYDQTQEHIFIQAGGQEDDLLVVPSLIDPFNEDEDRANLQNRRSVLRKSRGIVVALGLSFLACVLAFWLSDTLLSVPDQWFSIDFWLMLLNHRLLVLVIPAVCLILSYSALRSQTARILVTSEYYLDEREKLLRDGAYRSAFKMSRWGIWLIPCAFLLPRLPWFQPPPPLSDLSAEQQGYFVAALKAGWRMESLPSLPPASILEMVLAGGLLLLILLFFTSALPMAALAWKGKV